MANPLSEDQHLAAKVLVCETLSSGHVQNLNFTLGSVTVSGKMLTDVCWQVFLGKIGVVYCPWLTDHAEYYGANTNSPLTWNYQNWRVKNAFHVGFSAATDPRYQSLIVHEAVHAGFDMWKVPMNQMTGEAVAYVAQALYFMRSRQNALGGPILGAATNIAKQIARKAPIDAYYVTQLRDEILGDPHYAGKDMMNWQCVNNGV